MGQYNQLHWATPVYIIKYLGCRYIGKLQKDLGRDELTRDKTETITGSRRGGHGPVQLKVTVRL